ncbi:unnamed protein product [Parascedosporium putredinis]|uniref:NFACT RNA-binding domain-containing protein n=1 Tax=Parascedosporium putredinis TaxID=1442378 RepID=A0A9P1H9A1_9PEZI|nr:unnamed protein product [Parascedosporium putredinis]CAI8000152.1 unnamed protein product [Parascedosporium putredinis]
MVYYFTSTAVDPPAKVYVGKDKFENEDLIKYGWDEDVWFHVDKLSSAHIYLRMTDGQTWDTLPQALLTDLAQLTKANSIEGNKRTTMDVGQVSFHDQKRVRKVHVAQRENPIVNRLNKTKVEAKPDFKQEKENRLKELRQKEQAAIQARKKEELRQTQEYKEKKWQKDHAYDDLFDEDALAGASNQNRTEDWEDDFM